MRRNTRAGLHRIYARVKKGAEADIAAGKKFIEGVLLADHFDDATKFAMLQLAALFVTVDGEVTEQEQEYLSELCEKAMN